MNKRRVQVKPGLLGLSTISFKCAASFFMETRATMMREREDGGRWMRVRRVGSRCAVKSTQVSDHVASSSHAIQKKKKKESCLFFSLLLLLWFLSHAGAKKSLLRQHIFSCVLFPRWGSYDVWIDSAWLTKYLCVFELCVAVNTGITRCCQYQMMPLN